MNSPPKMGGLLEKNYKLIFYVNCLFKVFWPKCIRPKNP
jgi:hypothetical protein